MNNNLTVMRAWAQSVDSTAVLQTAPGQYNEAVFVGLDYALDQARQHSLKVSAERGSMPAGRMGVGGTVSTAAFSSRGAALAAEAGHACRCNSQRVMRKAD